MSRRPPQTAEPPQSSGGRLDYVLSVGFSKLKTQDPPRCCSIDKGFKDLAALNSYKTTKNGKPRSKITSGSDDDVCAICFEPLSSHASGFYTYALEGIFEPITQADLSPRELAARAAEARIAGQKRPREDPPVHQGCGHVFHRSCLRRWIVNSPNDACPVCRVPLDQATVASLTPAVFKIRDPVDDRLLYKEAYLDGKGTRIEYDGPKGEERVVKVTFSDSKAVQEYEGRPRGEGRMVRKTLPNGTVEEYEGPRGKERMVRKTLPNGTSTSIEST